MVGTRSPNETNFYKRLRWSHRFVSLQLKRDRIFSFRTILSLCLFSHKEKDEECVHCLKFDSRAIKFYRAHSKRERDVPFKFLIKESNVQSSPITNLNR